LSAVGKKWNYSNRCGNSDSWVLSISKSTFGWIYLDTPDFVQRIRRSRTDIILQIIYNQKGALKSKTYMEVLHEMLSMC